MFPFRLHLLNENNKKSAKKPKEKKNRQQARSFRLSNMVNVSERIRFCVAFR